ncbi:hypothetical protein MNBD_UNCLBAC01-1516 [hydrothermal vent metagenome]|uniref:Polysaccharide chain length determinant N-terminal domain-containing protein n=1 Tax=hydrothermal vent metagenome TaxID=652676 RepID=A0A3B1DNY9_9ZZZZ
MNNEQEQYESTLRDYLRVLFRHKMVILVTVLTVCLTVFVGLKLKTKVYQSNVKMLIAAEKQLEATYYKEYWSRDVQQTLTQSEIVKSSPVLTQVVKALNLDKRLLDEEKHFCSTLKASLIERQVQALRKKLDSMEPKQREVFLFRRAVDVLRGKISIYPIRDTNMFTISVIDYNPVAAARMANVLSRAYVIFDLQQQLAELELKYGKKHPKVILIDRSINRLKETLSGGPMEDIEALGPASVKIMEQASIARSPTGRSKKIVFGLAIVMSLFLSIMLAFVFEYMDQTIKSPQEIEQLLRLTFLGSIPRGHIFSKSLIKDVNKKSSQAKAYQVFSDQMYLFVKDQNLKSLLISPVELSNGAAKITANLGIYLASKLNGKVLIIDADLRRPILHKIFSCDKSVGLAKLLEGRVLLTDVVQSINKKLSIIPAGTTQLNPLTLLDSGRMKELLKQMQEQYSMILIHGADLSRYKDVPLLSMLVDGVVITIDEGASRRQSVKKSIKQLPSGKINLLGAILNNRTFAIPRFIYDRV